MESLFEEPSEYLFSFNNPLVPVRFVKVMAKLSELMKTLSFLIRTFQFMKMPLFAGKVKQ